MSKENIGLAYTGFKTLNAGNDMLLGLLARVEAVAPEPMINIREMRVGSDDAEDAMVEGLLRARGRDPRVIQLLKEITGRFMTFMKEKLTFVVTP